jgi:hypothetical protein
VAHGRDIGGNGFSVFASTNGGKVNMTFKKNLLKGIFVIFYFHQVKGKSGQKSKTMNYVDVL